MGGCGVFSIEGLDCDKNRNWDEAGGCKDWKPLTVFSLIGTVPAFIDGFCCASIFSGAASLLCCCDEDNCGGGRGSGAAAAEAGETVLPLLLGAPEELADCIIIEDK